MFLLPAQAEAQTPWYESYDRALEALSQEEWETAEAELRLALAEKGASGVRVRTRGLNFIEYFPYLKLGIAQFHQGNPDAALQAFDAEERLGEIAKSPSAIQELTVYRNRASRAKQEEDPATRTRLVQQNLRRARQLEEAGDIRGALSLIEAALAVNGDDRAALGAQQRLQLLLTEQEDTQARIERVADLTERGRGELEDEEFDAARATFERAVALARELPGGPDSGLLELRQRAADAVAVDLSGRSESERRRIVADGLEEVARLEETRQPAEALAVLGRVLEVDPANQIAKRAERRLLSTLGGLDRDVAREDRVGRLLEQVNALFDEGDDLGVMSASRQVLAIDDANMDALLSLGRARDRWLRRMLLGPDSTPPDVSILHDSDGAARLASDTELPAEVVGDPRFHLIGTFTDATRVSLSYSVETLTAERAMQIAEEGDSRGDADLEEIGEVTIKMVGDYYSGSFRVPHTLSEGLSYFRIVAVDENGNPSTRSHIVDYRPSASGDARPLGAIVIGFTMLGLIVSAAAYRSVVFLRRRRRRAELLRRHFNPFVAGAPVLDNDLFMGRENLVQRILQTVHNNSLLLYGERRIGKTSLQHQIQKRLKGLDDPEFKFFPVYIDLQGTPQEKFFWTIGHEVFDELEELLGDVKNGTAATAETDYTYRDLVRDLRAVLAALQKTTTKKVKLVLQMDEVDELNDYDPRVNQRLRSLFMRNFSENLASIVSGVGIKKHWESEGSPWYNFFEEIEVQPFRQEDAEELIQRPIRGVFDLEEGVVDRILEKTERRPYLIQKLCISLVNKLHEEKRTTLTVADVEAFGAVEGGD